MSNLETARCVVSDPLLISSVVLYLHNRISTLDRSGDVLG